MTVVKAYRLLRAIFNTAVRDKNPGNPCQITRADKEFSAERPPLSVSEVYRLADATAPRYRALVLLATFGNLWWGELAGLRRSNFSKLWARALAKAGLPAGTHVHDLRHTGNTFTAETGASLAELMNRMGHSSTRAARLYLHTRQERDMEIAVTLDRMAKREPKRARQRGGD